MDDQARLVLKLQKDREKCVENIEKTALLLDKEVRLLFR